LRDLRRPPDTAAARRIVALHAGNESRLLQEEYYRSLLAAFTPEEVRSQLRAAELTALTVLEVADRYLDVWGILP
ncbi:MAG: SAM-dependent methyltransferase, partial [Candidatus Hydrogenedentes bacterium]|nr:SAM-dependent methyltransferase [Candidatus Hydrogenedentota bacterium]